MSFIEWDFFTGDPTNVAASANTATPIEDAQSVRFQKTGPTGNLNRHILAVPKIAPLTLTGHGITKGRMRTLVRFPTFTVNNHHYGILSMMSTRDPVSGGTPGNFYACLVKPFTNTIDIRKFSSDVFYTSGDPGVSLVSAPVPAPQNPQAINTVYAMEFLWFLDVANFGGCLFQVKFGSALDYSDLAIIPALTFIDTSTPHLVSVAEGIGVTDGGNTLLFDYSFDNTELYSVGFA